MPMTQAEQWEETDQQATLEDTGDTDGPNLNEVYAELEEVTDETYSTVSDDVESFFQPLDAGRDAVIASGYIDIESDGDRLTVRYRSDQYRRSSDGTCPETTTVRYVPLEADGWDTVIEDVYAPLEMARTKMAYAMENGGIASEDVDRLEAYVDDLSANDVTAEDANRLLSVVDASVEDESGIHSRRTVYSNGDTYDL